MTTTAYPPPARPYVADAFAFPQLGALSLKNERCEMAAGCELFADQLTLIGCVGARFSEKMVDGWLEGVASAVADAQPPLKDSPAVARRWHQVSGGYARYCSRRCAYRCPLKGTTASTSAWTTCPR